MRAPRGDDAWLRECSGTTPESDVERRIAMSVGDLELVGMPIDVRPYRDLEPRELEEWKRLVRKGASSR